MVSLNYLGGPSLLLALLARAQDDHAVYAAVKVLQTVLSSSAVSESLMRGDRGYEVRGCCLFVGSFWSWVPPPEKVLIVLVH